MNVIVQFLKGLFFLIGVGFSESNTSSRSRKSGAPKCANWDPKLPKSKPVKKDIINVMPKSYVRDGEIVNTKPHQRRSNGSKTPSWVIKNRK